MATLSGVSMRRVCRVLKFPRARLRARAVGTVAAVSPRLDEVLAERIQGLIERHPTFGYRRLWALLRFGEGIRVNRKAIYRVLRLKGWFVHQRSVTLGPRVQGLKSRFPPGREGESSQTLSDEQATTNNSGGNRSPVVSSQISCGYRC